MAAFQQDTPPLDSPSLTFSLQALLHRHESYMAEAEEDRQRFLASIEGLEREKRNALTENARIVEENRGLLEQLDGLNQALAESDAHVKVLTGSLESTEAELRKLTASASRVADLEEQLGMMESEQSKLQETLLSVEEDKKSAVQRWKKAECTLRDLHDQVDKIEKESREERERHAELIQRLERRRAVERELDGAAGRLKGAAAASELGRNQGGTNVVSRFVRDILQDNANLQMGVMELRDMLHSSNQEVQSLRDQILSHQPLATEGDKPEPQLATLSEELDSKESNRVSQEFHIHHHYHTPNSKKDKGSLGRRGKKRRSLQGSLSSLRSASGTQLSQKSKHQRFPSNSSTSTILSQTSVSIPPAPSRRWSSQTPTDASIASSPPSNYRTSSIFDREGGFESSQPTSPESTIFSSPIIAGRYSKVPFDQQFQSLNGLEEAELAGNEQTNQDDLEPSGKTIEPVIAEEMQDSLPTGSEDVFMQFARGRSSSHDSLFSVAGMDIHTPTPSRMGSLHSTLPLQKPRRIISPSLELFSTPPTTSTTTITAGREPPKAVDRSPQSILASVAAGKNHSDTASMLSAESGSTGSTTTTIRKTPSLSRRMGGWVKGRWGTAPVRSNDSTDVSDSISSSPSVDRTKSRPESIPSLTFRYPGVNQSGPIRGFRRPPRGPDTVQVEGLDQNLLNESLAE
ncbi:hypothetical protein PHISCL_01802 [Aspergillus sclerotialis]|uniref:Uncharacterized protein n=1 Tax=Aspergillus sclerotialis TaxID=2070753 RepID=A0A3A2ZS15_9EURO|nr:hypothetical protein PHISCL_01802 [Aspergillus sclerotialis]